HTSSKRDWSSDVCSSDLAWLEAYLTTLEEPADPGDLPEAVAIQLTGTMVERYESSAAVGERVTGLLGAHPRIDERSLQVRLDEILPRTRRFRTLDVPAYRDFQRRRNELVAQERERLRVEEDKAKVLSGVVRNRLAVECIIA